MNFKKLLPLVALAGLAATSQAALINNNLYLGFRTETAGDNDLLVNLGSFTNIGSLNLDLGAQLTEAFGADWGTRGDITFALAGANNTGTRVLYMSNFGDGSGFTGTFSSSALSSATGQVYSMNAGIVVDTNDGSFTTRGGTIGSVFKTNSQVLDRSQWESALNFSNISATEFDVYSYTQGSGAWAETPITLSLNSAGVVSAIPEPSTYGLMGAGALGAIALVRRRRKKA